MTAPDFDVIHSWWIPALGGKIDAIPGVENETWFNARAAGLYAGQCAEFCGIQHAEMKATVEALPREEFEEWLEDEADAQEAGDSDLGEETYAGACAKCHGPEGEGDIGPQLQATRCSTTPSAVEEVVRNGLGEMPPVGGDWESRQMDALTDYLGRSSSVAVSAETHRSRGGSAAAPRAGSSPSTTSGSGSSTSRRRASSSSPAA